MCAASCGARAAPDEHTLGVATGTEAGSEKRWHHNQACVQTEIHELGLGVACGIATATDTHTDSTQSEGARERGSEGGCSHDEQGVWAARRSSGGGLSRGWSCTNSVERLAVAGYLSEGRLSCSPWTPRCASEAGRLAGAMPKAGQFLLAGEVPHPGVGLLTAPQAPQLLPWCWSAVWMAARLC